MCFTEEQAEVIRSVIADDLATMADLANLYMSTKVDMETVRLATKADIEKFRLLLVAEIEKGKGETIKWVGGLLLAQAAVIAALVKII